MRQPTVTDLSPAELGKYAAARKALDLVESGMKLGLGTGSTAKWFVDLLAKRMITEGLELNCVPTSSRTRAQAESLGIPVTTLDEVRWLDLTIDGADEFDPQLNLIKGGGGALLQEKIVATASDRMAVITDPSKEVAHLGAFPLPVELIRFGWKSTANQVERLLKEIGLGGRPAHLRVGDDGPYITDEGHYILDLELGEIADPAGLCKRLNRIAGVVENGLFTGIASQVIIGHADGSVRVVDAEKGDLGTSAVPPYEG